MYLVLIYYISSSIIQNLKNKNQILDLKYVIFEFLGDAQETYRGAKRISPIFSFLWEAAQEKKAQ
jgi:hypothetical protein